jgi:hypothetical protein
MPERYSSKYRRMLFDRRDLDSKGEIGEHPIDHELGDKTAIALDQLRATAVICADDRAHILGVEPT